MRDRRPELQHIEVVTLDDPSWWDDAPADSPFPEPATLDEPAPGRRRLVAGLVALTVVAVVAWVAVYSEDDETTPAPIAAGHFIIDASDLRPYSADIVTRPPANARYTLFANGNPTSPWISLQTYRRRGDALPAINSFRREVGGRNLIVPRNERSMTTIIVDLGDDWATDVRAFDIEDLELVQFANSLKLADDKNGKVLYDEEILAANSLMSTRTANWAEELLYGTVATEMRSVTPDGATITLRESIVDMDTRPATLSYFTTGRVEGSGGYTAGTLIANGDAIVTWAAADRLLSLTGPMPTSELLAISRTVRLADETEWQQLLYGLHPDYRLGEFTPVASGVAADGSPWSSGVQLAARGGRTEYLWWWTLPGTATSASTPTRSDVATRAGNDTIVVGGSTYVFIWVPATSSATTASVRAADGSTVTLQLRLPFAHVPVRLAATRIDVPGPVEISTA